MAENPQLFGNGMPVPFNGEMFVLGRDGVEFHVDKIPSAPGAHVKTKGTIYLSNIRMVFVANKPMGNFFAFDMPLLFVHGEKFNQPIFHCNNISGYVEPVVPDNQNRALYSTHTFKILFKEGGCGTFVPLFLNLIASVRRYNQFEAQSAANMAPRVDPLQAAQTPVDEMMRHVYVDCLDSSTKSLPTATASPPPFAPQSHKGSAPHRLPGRPHSLPLLSRGAGASPGRGRICRPMTCFPSMVLKFDIECFYYMSSGDASS